jgi:GT2 family glycosyltransferase
MFMLLDSKAFRTLGGFDERFFLYYEDVDLCCRIRLAGCSLTICPAVNVVHDARRASHRNLRFMKWHLASMIRFFCSPVFWKLWVRKLLRDQVR